MTASVAPAGSVAVIGRPTRLLPLSQLLNLSFYWLGLTMPDLDERTIDPEDLERFRAGLLRTSPRQGWSEWLLRGMIRVVCRLLGWRIEVAGVDSLPNDGDRPRAAGCLLVVAPHRAWIDPFLVLAVWPRDAARLVWLGDGATMVRSWWRRRLLPRLGMIPITPGSGGPRAYAELAAAALGAGVALVIFPEKGPPSAADATRPIAPGFAYFALRSGAPIVPVVLGGTHRIVRGSAFTVDILEPIAVGPAVADPFTSAYREPSRRLVQVYQDAVDAVLPGRTTLADARRPSRDRWPWLGTLFH